MVKIQQRVLIFVVLVLLVTNPIPAQKFLPGDPIQVMPPPTPVGKVLKRDIDQLYDFLNNSIAPDPRPPVPAGAINTLGEVPDNSWFTNRHGRNRMSREQLQRGPETGNAPVPPFLVIGGKNEGITPAFRMRDSAGRLYFVKVDPPSNPEMATGAEVVVSKFLYAGGYNTPENYIVYARSADFRLYEKAEIKMQNGSSRRMLQKDLDAIVARIPRDPGGSVRMMASLAIPGELIGPFRYEGSRTDDPNDTVPHEQRRDLRGLSVFAAWLNHTDMKANNTLDAVVEENGVRFIRHYLIDFSSALGSDGDRAKDPRFGHQYMIPKPWDLLRTLLTLGLLPGVWEKAHLPTLSAAGNFESATFDPDEWKSSQPNPALLSRLPDDEFWAAKQIMAFSNDDIRAIVETGRYSDTRTVDYLTKTLIERRDMIGCTYFSKLDPLDNFRTENGKLMFEDLAAFYGLRPAVEHKVHWFHFDNASGQKQQLAGSLTLELPIEAQQAATGEYFSSVIDAENTELKSVTVYIRKADDGYDVVGVERLWPHIEQPEIQKCPNRSQQF